MPETERGVVPHELTLRVFRRWQKPLMARVIHETALRHSGFSLRKVRVDKHGLSTGEELRYTIEEAVQEACKRIIESKDGKRQWNRKEYPTLFGFIMSVVDSVISHEWHRWVGAKAPTTIPDDLPEPVVHRRGDDPVAQAMAREHSQRINNIVDRIAASRPALGVVLAYKRHDLTAEKAAEKLGVPCSHFRNVIVKRTLNELKSILSNEWDAYSKE